ncbi:heme o synthase [Halomonas sp. GFAJ-1]|uniref:heme o synthase n=1 Tax=Halomonas sp. GFAJ-1 TaxID=1118153 RepID=UPI00023A164E|nr:heme o synthase [Halomonas sp. GFAJ-1]AVI62596.1 protoheme IX farnesyltransferase [Halomonas sp. GFAJ-1]EHK62405.1 protoheme IX farnesyltransferase [Halomonas sp. GFAJ-1]
MEHAASVTQHDGRLKSNPSRWRDLLALTKPGIIGGNLIATVGGYFLAAQGAFEWVTFISVIVGISLIIASGCACNNVIDRDIDALMARTRHRPLAKGRISITQALGVSALLGVVGVVCLALGTNGLAVALAVIGWGVYVGVYSLYMKRHSEYGTLVGSLSGAMPPVVGYCAVTGQFDSGALMLLIIFCLWQMPHSYAIAIFRYADYQRASIPVLPVVHGIKRAKHHILGYIIAFIPASLALALASQAGTGYLLVALAMGGYWLYLALCGFRLEDDVRWAKKIFGVSILTITAMSLVMVLEAMVPMWT